MVAMTETLNTQAEQGLSIAGPAPSGVLGCFLGATLCIAAAGLWLMPGAIYDPALILIKLGLTLFFALAGIMLLLASRKVHHPEVHLDGQRGLLRLLLKDERGTVQQEVEVQFEDLSEVDFRDGMLIARDHHGQSVVEMPIDNVGNMEAVRAQLGPAFSRTA